MLFTTVSKSADGKGSAFGQLMGPDSGYPMNTTWDKRSAGMAINTTGCLPPAYWSVTICSIRSSPPCNFTPATSPKLSWLPVPSLKSPKMSSWFMIADIVLSLFRFCIFTTAPIALSGWHRTSKTVKAFIQSGKNQTVITERVQIKASPVFKGTRNTDHLSNHYYLPSYPGHIVNGGNRSFVDHPARQKTISLTSFGEIYRKRWGIETCFFVIKSFFQLTNFSAYTPGNCWQDIYSTFILYNIQTALHRPLQKQIRKINRKRLHDYKPNRNISGGLLKRFLVKFMLRPLTRNQGISRRLLPSDPSDDGTDPARKKQRATTTDPARRGKACP